VGPIAAPPRLNLPVIAATLQSVQREFDAINRRLAAWRDPMSDDVIANMVAGYALVDALVADRVDLFAMGNLNRLLELNKVVLCGANPDRHALYTAHVEATARRFYDERHAGIEDVVEWYAGHAVEPVWTRAAGVYVRILSKPQLFIEGNHRTGALVMSYVLVREGQPPFVLSADNAAAYFEPSATIRDSTKTGVATFFRQVMIRRRLTALLLRHCDRRHLTA